VFGVSRSWRPMPSAAPGCGRSAIPAGDQAPVDRDGPGEN